MQFLPCSRRGSCGSSFQCGLVVKAGRRDPFAPSSVSTSPNLFVLSPPTSLNPVSSGNIFRGKALVLFEVMSSVYKIRPGCEIGIQQAPDDNYKPLRFSRRFYPHIQGLVLHTQHIHPFRQGQRLLLLEKPWSTRCVGAWRSNPRLSRRCQVLYTTHRGIFRLYRVLSSTE